MDDKYLIDKFVEQVAKKISGDILEDEVYEVYTDILNYGVWEVLGDTIRNEVSLLEDKIEECIYNVVRQESGILLVVLGDLTPCIIKECKDNNFYALDVLIRYVAKEKNMMLGNKEFAKIRKDVLDEIMEDR